MQTKIQKWGNSLGIRIPNFIANQLSLNSGDLVDITLEKEQISIRHKKQSLSIMLDQITEKNIHNSEWEDSDIKGQESW